jgi:hypothetical protein
MYPSSVLHAKNIPKNTKLPEKIETGDTELIFCFTQFWKAPE